MQRVLPASVIILALAILTLPATAQDRFGGAVAAEDGMVYVLKPSLGRGPAAVYVYRLTDDGTWQPGPQLLVPAGDRTGEGFGQSIATSGDMLFVASGDPQVRIGAHLFRRTSEGIWNATASIVLPGAEGAAGLPPEATLDFAAILRIMQPPPRVVAAHGQWAIVSVPGGPAPTRGVWVRERRSDEWAEVAKLEGQDLGANDLYGAAVMIRDDLAVVGAPRHGTAGAVYVFARHTAGEWHQTGKLEPDSAAAVPRGSAFGSALAIDGETILVGVPGARQTTGQVLLFARNTDGSWLRRGSLAPSSGTAGDGFGSSLALHGDELWIGAPRADEFRGRLYRYGRTEAGEWSGGESFALEGAEPRFGVGASVALSAQVAVVGAPFADGGLGRAVVFARRSDRTWGEPTWLSPGTILERVVGREVRCAEGKAEGFSCQNVDLLAFLPIRAIGGGPGEGVSDLWGWTDPHTKKEYALVGRSGGVAIVDITSPTGPRYLGVIPGNRSGARDIKVYKDYLFFTGDGAGNHGLLVFDLTRLRTVENPPVTFEPDARYDEIASAHNLIIDTESGFAFTVGNRDGGNTCGGGLHMVDIRDPLHPTFAGCYTDTEGLIWPGRTHDAQCVVYHGPDEQYHGRQICLAANETALRIVDVTDKENPIPIAAATYPGISYVHQGWLTDDQRYFYLDDELDELVGRTDRTRTLVWDIADLDDPVLVGQHLGSTGATDHNLYVKGNRMYQANYYAGLRVLDISDPKNPVEIGHFDTTPYEGNPPGFGGAWTAFPFFESGTVIVSSMHEGLFVLKPRMQELLP